MLYLERRKNALVARIDGELDDSEASRVRAEVDAAIAETGTRRLIFDFSALRFMDSSGIGLVIGRYKRMRRCGGSVAVIGSNPRIDGIFEMAGLYKLVERRTEGRA